MDEWLYKATTKRVSFQETFDLANEDGFICRSAYNKNKTRVANTQHVEFGHIIHIYYSEEDTLKVIGTFEVVGRQRHPHPSRFKKIVSPTALFEVDDGFAQKLVGLGEPDAERYTSDPVLKKLTGWALVKRKDIATPSLAEAQATFTGRSTLVRRRIS